MKPWHLRMLQVGDLLCGKDQVVGLIRHDHDLDHFHVDSLSRNSCSTDMAIDVLYSLAEACLERTGDTPDDKLRPEYAEQRAQLRIAVAALKAAQDSIHPKTGGK